MDETMRKITHLTLLIAGVLGIAGINWTTTLQASTSGSFPANRHTISQRRTELPGTVPNTTRLQQTHEAVAIEALGDYGKALVARRSEIFERLKQLDSLIDEPRSNSPLDDPALSPVLKPRPDVSGLVAEYDVYRAELSELTKTIEEAASAAKLALGLQAGSCPPLTTISGTLGTGSPDFPANIGQQTGRILNGLGNITCGSSNPCTLNTTTGLRTFDAYTFMNTGATTACVTVSFEMTGCSLGQAMQFSARLGSFDPANPCANYLGDGGAGFSGEFDGQFSFNVPAGQTFVVVVNENDPAGATGCAYSLTISGLPCQAICPPATPISGTLGSGSPDVQAVIGQQTGRILNGLGNIACGSSNPCTLNTTSGQRTFDAYAFINPGASTACVTVSFEMTGCSLSQAMQFSARLGSFDPSNPCANYVGDGGAGFSGEFDGQFSFNVPAGQTFVVVVNENDPGDATGCAYSLTISGITCPVVPCLIACPSNITQSNDPGQCGAVVSFPAPGTTGDCGAVVCNPPGGSFFPTGTTTVNCLSAAGPSCSFTVTVNDTQPPAISCPSNISTGSPIPGGGAVVTFSTAASDNCGVASTVCVPPSGSSFPPGTTTVNCTASDGSGNTASCSFTVSISNLVVKDDATGNVLRLTHTGGPTAPFEFLDCSKGTKLSGIATVTTSFCKINIAENSDPKKPGKRVSATINTCTLKGTATIQIPGSPIVTLNDGNVSNSSPVCP
jgi:hypothetical protein